MKKIFKEDDVNFARFTSDELDINETIYGDEEIIVRETYRDGEETTEIIVR